MASRGAREQGSGEGGWDIEIVLTGRRPGEKLCEELFREEQRVGVTKHQHILIAEAADFDGERLHQSVLELERPALWNRYSTGLAL